MKAFDFRVQVSHGDRVTPREAVEHLLKICKFIKSGWGEVRSDEQGMLCAGNDFADHHVWPVEVHGVDDLYFCLLPNYQSQPPLRFPGCSEYRLGAHNAVSQTVVSLNCVRNICLCQNHQVIVTKLHGLDGLGEAKSTAILDIVCSEVYPWGTVRTAPGRRRHCVDQLSSME